MFHQKTSVEIIKLKLNNLFFKICWWHFSFSCYIFIQCFLLTQTFEYRYFLDIFTWFKNTVVLIVAIIINVVINISGNRCIFNYIIVPGIYYSGARLDVPVSILCIIAFTVLYSHNQHTVVTSVKVVSKVKIISLGSQCTFCSTRIIITQSTRYLGAR